MGAKHGRVSLCLGKAVIGARNVAPLTLPLSLCPSVGLRPWRVRSRSARPLLAALWRRICPRPPSLVGLTLLAVFSLNGQPCCRLCGLLRSPAPRLPLRGKRRVKSRRSRNRCPSTSRCQAASGVPRTRGHPRRVEAVNASCRGANPCGQARPERQFKGQGLAGLVHRLHRHHLGDYVTIISLPPGCEDCFRLEHYI